MNITACLASSLDGFIAPLSDNGQYVCISSQADIAHLKALRAQFAVTLMGGETFRAWPNPHLDNTGRALSHWIVCQHVSEDWAQTPLFKAIALAQVPQAVIFSAQPLPKALEGLAQWVPHTGCLLAFAQTTLPAYAQSQNINTLLCEGGGRLFQALVQAHQLETLYLTLSRVILSSGIPLWPEAMGLGEEIHRFGRLVSATPLADSDDVVLKYALKI